MLGGAAERWRCLKNRGRCFLVTVSEMEMETDGSTRHGLCRLLNFCARKVHSTFVEVWLIRWEDTNELCAVGNQTSHVDLSLCSSFAEANQTLITSKTRPLPYHLMHVTVHEDEVIDWHQENMWLAVHDVDKLRDISKDVRVMYFDVLCQEEPDGREFHRTKVACLGDERLIGRYTSEHVIAGVFTEKTNVMPTKMRVTLLHRNTVHEMPIVEGDRCRERVLESLFRDCREKKQQRENLTFTVYMLYLNKAFASKAVERVCSVLHPGKRAQDYCYWSANGTIFLDDPRFRMCFFVDPNLMVTDPLNRVMLEYYTGMPCEKGVGEASAPGITGPLYERLGLLKLRSGEQEIEAEEDVNGHEDKNAATRQSLAEWNGRGLFRYIAVFDYAMFYPHVIRCMDPQNRLFSSRVEHMAANRQRFAHIIKPLYTKEIGGLRLRASSTTFHERLLCVGKAILETLEDSCKSRGLSVITRQTDGVTVLVPVDEEKNVWEICEQLQEDVKVRFKDFRAPLKVERTGTSMLYFHDNKHVLYGKNEHGVWSKACGMYPSSLCHAVVQCMKSIIECPTRCKNFFSPCTAENLKQLKNDAELLTIDETDLMSDSIGISSKSLIRCLYGVPGENNLFDCTPTLLYDPSKKTSLSSRRHCVNNTSVRKALEPLCHGLLPNLKHLESRIPLLGAVKPVDKPLSEKELRRILQGHIGRAQDFLSKDAVFFSV